MKLPKPGLRSSVIGHSPDSAERVLKDPKPILRRGNGVYGVYQQMDESEFCNCNLPFILFASYDRLGPKSPATVRLPYLLHLAIEMVHIRALSRLQSDKLLFRPQGHTLKQIC